MAELREFSINNQSRSEEFEQYVGCLCLSIDGVFTEQDESSDDVLDFTKYLFKEAKVAVPDNVLNHIHRSDKYGQSNQ